MCMKIKNFNELRVTNVRKDALSILDAGLQAIDTDGALMRILDTTCENIDAFNNGNPLNIVSQP